MVGYPDQKELPTPHMQIIRIPELKSRAASAETPQVPHPQIGQYVQSRKGTTRQRNTPVNSPDLLREMR